MHRLLVTAISVASLALLGVLLHERLDWFRKSLHPWLLQHATLLGAYRSLAAFVAFPVIIIGGVLGFLDLRSRLSPPDLELRFSNARSVSFTVINSSATVAAEPKYMLALWSLGAPSGTVEKPSSLEIPVKLLDTMRPHSGLGSWTIASLSKSTANQIDGTVVFGFATVSCPACLGERTYLVYYETNRGGWVREVPDYEAPAARAAVGRVLADTSALATTLDAHAPIRERKPIL